MGRTARVSREQVLAAARETFVERGYEGATLAGIGAKLAVSPAALLRHAPNKRALFLACMGSNEPDMAPLAFLQELDGIRGAARRCCAAWPKRWSRFSKRGSRQIVARWVYFKTLPGIGRVPLPFDPNARPTPPQRNLRFLEDYIRSAVKRGRLSVANPRAAAFAFFATVHSFVFLQHVVEALEKPMPLDEYLDTVLDIWTRGAVAPASRRRKR